MLNVDGVQIISNAVSINSGVRKDNTSVNKEDTSDQPHKSDKKDIHYPLTYTIAKKMRKPRRHRWLTLSVVMIAYSVFQAVMSNPSEPAENPDKLPEPTIPHVPENTKTTNSIKESDVTPIATKEESANAADGKKSMKGFEIEPEEGEKKKQKDAGYEDGQETAVIRETEKIEEEEEDAIPTVHPLRNCTPPAIEQFPRPLMGQTARKHGGLILHILVAVFTFIGLAIVCDEYFVSSLDRICEELQLAPDVAGATFMAAGSSAPELATVVIGVFCAQDDIGVSGVIGSAVFNIMFVISVCALCAGTVSHLNWWPLCRDCFFYAVSILVMLCTIANGYPPAQPAYYKAKEYNPETAVDPLVKPEGANVVQLACWYVAYPVHWSCRHTMPDCRGRWYPITFIISMLWISFYSYFMVWMITIIGYTLGIPDTVMGLTFVAAGVSVPDALSSLAVIKEGYGDMAVSNAVGSNVFDILVCLGLPWFIQTAIIQPGSHVNVISKGLIYSTLSLFSTVVFLVLATHANGWKLDRKFGAVLMVWYLLFITLASLYELNVFGNIHPPDCESSY
ncbi:jg13340 [Pararge aegeria aegeria]|uniref:Jg13340 protein n=1 Tax=Pararge aegeria aegeria TaxID=348720 RepID=A0A8S4SM51_9NEOP|nr:jg13340 [Pararge aegeria aegeria]